MLKRRILIILFIALAVSVDTINTTRPVYKMLLTQQGFTQFLQYDVESPPLQEFTFCTWIKVHDFLNDQTIFTYVVKGDKHVILRLLSGGSMFKITIAGRSAASVPVNMTKGVWSHVCLSYQSDYGALALYLNSRIVTCEAIQMLEGLTLPEGGSIIVGYGTNNLGKSSGFEGEIYGVTMILLSTIEKNYTIETIAQYDQQKRHTKNTLNDVEHKKQYIVLDELELSNHNQTYPIRLKTTRRPPIRSTTPIKVHHTSPYSAYKFLDHDVGIDISSKRPLSKEHSNEIEIIDYIQKEKDTKTQTEKNRMNFWKLVNKADQEGKFKIRPFQTAEIPKIVEISSSGTQDLPTVSVFETPPPPGPPNQEFYEKGLEMVQPPSEPTLFAIPENYSLTAIEPKNKILDMETPPPPLKNPEVFGQWSSSKFASSVLNYLKSFQSNFQYTQEKKIPNTIPLTKLSDSLPYASNLRISTKILVPPKLQRRKFVDQGFNIINKRPLIKTKVHILVDDLRECILKSHAETKPIRVEITNRGANKNNLKHRRYRNLDYYNEDLSTSSEGAEKQSNVPIGLNRHKITQDSDEYNSNHLFTVIPLKKPVEDIIYTSTNSSLHQFTDMYKTTMTEGNKWHNTKTYNNEYTPRRINMEPYESNIGKTKNNRLVKNQNGKHKFMYDAEFIKYINHGRALAQKVSASMYNNEMQVPITKYNDEFLPGYTQPQKQFTVTEAMHELPFKYNNEENASKAPFDKPVKIGNALNELHLVGLDEKEKRESFVGGDDKVPDINRYRSDIDREDNEDVPPSLRLRECKHIDDNNNARSLYVHADGSINNMNMTDKFSLIKLKNKAIEFIITNYKTCSLEGSTFSKSSLLIINWRTTPVRLFGGAYPKKTKDLCWSLFSSSL